MDMVLSCGMTPNRNKGTGSGAAPLSLPSPWSQFAWGKFLGVVVLIFCFMFGVGENLGRSILATGFIAGWFALALLVQQKPKLAAERISGTLMLGWRSGPRYAFPSVIVGPVAALVLTAGRSQQARENWVFWLIVVCVIAAWVAMHMAAREEFRILEDRIERRSPWTGRSKALTFGSLVSIEWDAYSRFVLVAASGQRLSIFHRIDGIGEFAEIALRKAPVAVWTKSGPVKPMLEYIASRYLGTVKSH